MPVTGYYQPVRVTLTITSGAATTVFQGDYAVAGAAGTGGITVQLKPDLLPGSQWRFLGDTLWRNSGTSVTGLVAGTYLVESKPVAGRTTPQPLVAYVNDGQVTTVYPTYYVADTVTGTTPSVLPFATVTGSPTLPYQFVGQFRTDIGSGTGFVVTKRVVATVAHLVFDYGGLTPASNQQWLFLRDSASYEPVPHTPHGFYVFTSYSAALQGEGTPGTSSPASQVQDVAAVYFTDSNAAPSAGRSGYLASDNVANEWLTDSSSLKMLVGYPADGISASDQGRMFATTPVTVPFTAASSVPGGDHPVTYTTSAISSVGGNSGGPLCVQVTDPTDGVLKYYPAAIYLGGTGQAMVRVIDSDVLIMFDTAEQAGEDGLDHVGAGVTRTDSPISTGATKGLLTVNITQPATARWGVSSGNYVYASPHTQSESVGIYYVYFQPVNGYVTPQSPYPVTITGNTQTTLTATYLLQQTIRFIPPLSMMLTDPPLTLSASATSGQPVTFSLVSGPATLTGSTLTPTGIGTVTVQADQAGDGTNYAPAASVSAIITITGPNTYAVTPSSGANGGITPSNAQVVNTGSGATFTANPSNGYVVNQWLLDGNVVQNGGNSYTVSDVMTNHSVLVTFTPGTGSPARAQMIGPSSGSALGSSSATFTWNAGTGASAYALYVGSSPGANDIYARAEGSSLTDTVNNLPVDGRAFYVTLWSFINGQWLPVTYVYTAVDNRTKMASPAGGTMLTGTTATFNWNASNGAGAYALYVGSAPGAYDIYAKAEGTGLTDTVNNLPVDGRTLYVTLWSFIDGKWASRSYYYTAVDNRAQMITPANGTALASSSATFTWSAGSGVGAYALYVGSSPGAYDIYAKAEGGSLTDTVNNLPVDGRPIYVTLFSLINGTYHPNSYSYTAADNRAQMTSPVNGSVLGSSSVNFTWTAGTGVGAYALYMGSSPGVFDIYAKAEGVSLSDTVNIPSGAINGHTIYVRLYSYLNGAWVYNSYVYTASDSKAQMTAPAGGSVLTSASATFSWSAGTGVSAYALYVGSSPGVFDLYAKYEGINTTDTVSNLPVDGRPIYVRLYSLTSAGWRFNGYTISAFTDPAGPLSLMTSPANGSTLASASAAFTWSAGNGVGAYALYAGSTPGAYDIYAKAEGTSLTDTVTNLPVDGSPVYVTLFSLLSGQWEGVKSHYATTAQGTSPKGLLTGPSPANGSTLTSGQLALNWSAAASQGTQYALYVGSAPHAYDIYAKAEGSSLSDTVPVPVDGRRLFVTLWTLINGSWQPASYYYDTTE